jgi:hypothetical protein
MKLGYTTVKIPHVQPKFEPSNSKMEVKTITNMSTHLVSFIHFLCSHILTKKNFMVQITSEANSCSASQKMPSF